MRHRTGRTLPTVADHFPDDDRTTHEASIDRIAAAGITSGLSHGGYGVAASVTRGAMAPFVARTLDPIVAG